MVGTLRLSLLGAPVVDVDGQPVVFDTRKATALLAYLVVEARPHRRESLAELCWPDADRERAGAALRRTLSTIRQAVGSSALRTEAGTVAVDLEHLEADVLRARQLLGATRDHGHPSTAVCPRCAGPLAEVADLHRGEFLEGFTLRDSVVFEDWRAFTAAELRRDLAETLTRLADVRIQLGEWDLAEHAARRRLALDPLHEQAHRSLMRLHAWRGRRNAALHQYRECVRVLDTELGVQPLDETTALYEQVLSGRVPPPPSAPSRPPLTAVRSAAPAVSGGRRLARRLVPVAEADAPATPGPPGPRLVGRDEELTRLVELVSGAGPDGVVVVVEGEPGIGKTRLVSELARHPELSGRPLLLAGGRQGESGLPYGLVVEAIREAGTGPSARWRDAVRPDVVAEVARLLPELADEHPSPPATDPGASWRLLDALGSVLAAAVETTPASAPPGVLVVEDVHWVDAASLDVLAHLARRLRGRRLALVLSWRSELVGPGHPLSGLLAELARDDRVHRIHLERLDVGAVRAMVVDALGGAADGALPSALTREETDGADVDALAVRVAEATEGVPLLVLEYLRALAADPAALDGPPPRGAHELFDARLAAVGETALQVLTTAAVIGRSFDPDLVHEASGRAEEETAAALDELAASGLIVELDAAEPGYDFVHARLRALAYERAGLARRRLLHRRVAAALESRVARGRSPGRLAAAIAVHHRAAGDDEAAARWSAEAGHHAAGLLALTEAVDHFEAALALGHPDAGEIHEALGDVATLAGRYGDALRSYEAAAARSDGDRFAAVEHKIGALHLRWGQWVLADQHLGVALAALEEAGDPAATARVLADRGLVAHRQGLEDEAAAWAKAALERAEAADDLAALAAAHNLLGVLNKQDLSLARHHLEHALALARRLHDLDLEIAAANNLARAHAAAGALERALTIAESALARAAARGDRHRQAALHDHLADLLRGLGREEEAMAALRTAVTLFAEVGDAAAPTPEIWKLAQW